MKRPSVDVLSFEGCPNREQAIKLVERVAADLGIDPEVRLVDIPDAETAERGRFLGSPTIRVNGQDVEPGADQRTSFVHSCRLYRTDAGVTGQPDEEWVREALSAV